MKIGSLKNHTLPTVVNIYCGAFLPVILKRTIGSRLNVFKAWCKVIQLHSVCSCMCQLRFISFRA